MTLEQLLHRAGIGHSAYWRNLWFGGCVLNRNLLTCPDRETAKSIDAMFLPQLRGVIADVEICIGERAEPVKSVWKPQLKEQPQTFNQRLKGGPTQPEEDLLT